MIKERRRERYKVELLRYICVTKGLSNKVKNCADYLCIVYFVREKKKKKKNEPILFFW